jgi:CSLREA domain-containing protein
MHAPRSRVWPGLILALLAVAAGSSAQAAPAKRAPTLVVTAPAAVAAGSDIPITLRLRDAHGVRAIEARISAGGGSTYGGFRRAFTGRLLGPAATLDGVALGAYDCPQSGCGDTLGRVRLLAKAQGILEIHIGSVQAVDSAGRSVRVVVDRPVLRVRVGGSARDVAGSPHRLRPSATAARRSTDLTQDRRLDFADVAQAELAWQLSRESGFGCGAVARTADVTGDGCVTVSDVQAVLGAVRRTAGRPARAQTLIARSAVVPGPIVVDSGADDADAIPGDGDCATASGACTLRAAIAEANAHVGPDTIAFAIPGGGVRTINVTSSLPTLSDRTGGTTIDGYSQPGSSPNTDPVESNARLTVQVQGTGITVGMPAFTLSSADNVVRGLAVFNVRPILISGAAAVRNSIVGNFIGTDAAAGFGATALVRNAGGVVLARGASSNVVGRAAPADRNVISGNAFTGIYLQDVGTNDNVMMGNIIGLSPDGLRRIRNQRMGVDINLGAKRTIVGGLGPGEGNVISGNTGGGAEVSHTTETVGNVIQGNLIGTNLTGTAVPTWTHNSEQGVHVEDGVQGTVIEGNVIGDNYFGGIVVEGVLTAGTVLRGNWVGTAPNGTTMGNRIVGIGINSASGTTVTSNVVSRNQGAGVAIDGPAASGNTISRNQIWANAGLAIDLAPAGVNPNDLGDGDSGPNRLLNFPDLESVDESSVIGSACTGCVVELFTADQAAGAHGGGRTLLGSATVGTDGRFAIAGLALAPGTVVSATATDTLGNTSEMSRNVIRADVPPPPPPAAAADSFARLVTGAWGDADSGGPWTLFGPTADFSVDGVAGQIALPAPDGAARAAVLDALSLPGAADAVVRLRVDRRAVGANLYGWISVRHQPSGSEYRARLRLGPAGNVHVGLAVVNGSTETFPTGEVNTKLTYAAGTDLLVRIQASGSAPTTVRVRVWPAGTPEPVSWMQTLTSSVAALQGAGSVSLGARRSLTESGGPVVVSFDDLVAGS